MRELLKYLTPERWQPQPCDHYNPFYTLNSSHPKGPRGECKLHASHLKTTWSYYHSGNNTHITDTKKQPNKAQDWPFCGFRFQTERYKQSQARPSKTPVSWASHPSHGIWYPDIQTMSCLLLETPNVERTSRGMVLLPINKQLNSFKPRMLTQTLDHHHLRWREYK